MTDWNTDYRNQRTMPTKPRRPLLAHDATGQQARSHADLIEGWEKDMAAYNIARDAWAAENARLIAKFWADAAEDLGLTGNPKLKRLQEIAWADGHSEGFHAVYYRMSELADLIQ